VVADPNELAAQAAVGTEARTVLVVDDEADIRKLLKRLLDSRGYRVVEADRGLQALRLVKEHTPDLIVLDAMLPEVHGFDIARRIKGSRRYGRIPIIMVSAVYRGWRYAEDLKQSCGVEHYIEKPFRIADVMRAVDQCLEDGDAGGQSDAEEISAEAEQALNAGVAAYKAGKVAEAVEHLKRGIGIDPLAYRLHFHLGLLYGKAGQIYEAISELETAIEINSEHFPAVKNLAVLYQKAGFRNRAAEASSAGVVAVARKPGSVAQPEVALGLRGDHSSATTVTGRLLRPTLGLGRATLQRPSTWPCSGWGLPCHNRCRLRGGLLPRLFTLA
jgi:CheY-like chemotaxis protein